MEFVLPHLPIVHYTQALEQPPSIYGPSSSSPSASLLSRTLSRVSLISAITTDTFLNRDTTREDPTIPLRTLLDIIKRHRSLQDARIVQVDSYRRPKLPRHRFTVMQLEREGRDQIWLRIDRRRDKRRSFLNFAINAGTSPANDRVSQWKKWSTWPLELILCRLGSHQTN